MHISSGRDSISNGMLFRIIREQVNLELSTILYEILYWLFIYADYMKRLRVCVFKIVTACLLSIKSLPCLQLHGVQ